MFFDMKTAKGKDGIKLYSRMLSDLKKTQVRSVMVKSINKAGSEAHKLSKRVIAKRMGLPQKDIKDDLHFNKAKVKKTTPLRASLVHVGSPKRLIKFKAKQKYKKTKGLYRGAGVTAKAWGQTKLYKNAFIASVKYSGGSGEGETVGVFARKTKNPLPIKQLYGAGVARESERGKDPIWKVYREVLGKQIPIKVDEALKKYNN